MEEMEYQCFSSYTLDQYQVHHQNVMKVKIRPLADTVHSKHLFYLLFYKVKTNHAIIMQLLVHRKKFFQEN